MSYPNDPPNDGAEEYKPWYSERSKKRPFKLSRKISLKTPEASAFRSLAFFPWAYDSTRILWRGKSSTPEAQRHWESIVDVYWDAVAVTSDSLSLYIFFTHQTREPISVKLTPVEGGPKILDVDKMCVAWAMSSAPPFEPLIVFSQGSVVYVYNVERRGISGYLRGHGGVITSIAVHPINVHMFCTTSRDYSTRIYTLDLDAQIDPPHSRASAQRAADQKVTNPHWPPSTKPSLAGAAHGLRLPISEQEGKGRGRCIAVLMGGRSGGHDAAVLSAAFNRDYPLIATCGMDRAVKIWLLRPDSDTVMKREDKPLFSSTMLHKARVMSISWLESDLLLTHSAPAIMRVYPDDPLSTETRLEAGELTIWRWLGVDRYFPAMHEGRLPLRPGVSSDYQESSSFKIISTHRFPDVPSQLLAPTLSLYNTPIHDPIILINYPRSTGILLVNAALMSPRPPPPLPTSIVESLLGGDAPAAGPPPVEVDRADEAAPVATGSMPLRAPDPNTVNNRNTWRSANEEEEERAEAPAANHDDDDEDDDEQLDHADLEEEEPPPPPASPPADGPDNEDEEDKFLTVVRRLYPAPPPPPVQGWGLLINPDGTEDTDSLHVMASAMGLGGRVIAAVGTGGTFWVWKYQD